MYEYKASVLRVIDGDTVRARVDMGLDCRIDLTLRLAHIDTPELPSVEGIDARDSLTAWLNDIGGQVVIRTIKDRREKFGRYLAELYDPINLDKSLNQQLVEAGLATPWVPR